jgi:hypothetical protein
VIKERVETRAGGTRKSVCMSMSVNFIPEMGLYQENGKIDHK